MDKKQEVVTQQQSKRRVFTQQEKEQHLAAWEESGLSAGQYGSENGLHASQLYAWRQRGKDRRGPESEESLFVPIRLGASSGGTGGLSVTLRHRDLEFVVSGADSSGTLVSILRAIKREVIDV